MCPKCEVEKTFDCFHKSKQTGDGLQGHCKLCRSAAKKIYRAKNKDRINAQNRRYYQDNKEFINSYTKKYYRDNIDKYNKWHKLHREKASTKEYQRNWQMTKYHNDNKFRLNSCFGALIRHSVSKGRQNSFENIVPYSLDDLMTHLSAQFDDKMTWDNYGTYWHIDHIIPRVKFQFTTYLDKGFQECWRLSNLQPLEKIENLKKGARCCGTLDNLKENI